MVSKIGPKTIFLSIFTLLLFLLLWTSSSKVGLADGSPVALWHMDEGNGTTIFDSSGNGNDGTIYGATWVDGKVGKALSFDGINDYVSVPDSADLRPTAALTVEVWINARSLTSSDWGPSIISKYGGNWQGYMLFLYATTKKPAFNTFTSSPSNTGYWLSDDVISVNQWYHLVGVWNGTHSLIYVNGEFKKSVEAPNVTQDTIKLRIGAESWANFGYFNGTIDEVAIYDYALSASEIQQHYEGDGEEDTTSPTVSVSHTPSSPTNSTSVTITTTASDNVGVTEINVYVDASLAKTCSSSPCSTTSQTYSIGTHTYYATASDAANNTGRDPSSGTKSFTVQEEEVTPVCGNNIKETGEECDGTDDSACPGQCQSDCTCYVTPPEENEYSDFTLDLKPTSITDSQVGEVVTVTTDEYDLVVDWTEDKYVDFKIKPKFTSNTIRYRRGVGESWHPGTVDENGTNLNAVINMNIGAWGRSGNVAWFYENSTEFSLNHTFTFYRDYLELDVHYKPGTKNVKTRYLVGLFDSSNKIIHTDASYDPTIYSPGASETYSTLRLCDYGMGGWYPRIYWFAPVFDWRVPTSDIAVEWGYNGFPVHIYTPYWPTGCSGFKLEFTSIDSVVPHPAAGTEEDFHMFIRPYQANDGQRRGHAYGYAQWIGPKTAMDYQPHRTPVFPLIAFGWGQTAFVNYVTNSEIKIGTYASGADQFNLNYNSAQYAEPETEATADKIHDDWELWQFGPGQPLIGVNDWVVLNPVVDAVRYNLLQEHPYMDWYKSSEIIFWDEVNLAYIDNSPRQDYHYWDDYVLEGYLKLIQDSYDTGYWEYVMVNPWTANMHVCFADDMCMVEGYLHASYSWATPRFIDHLHSVMNFINNMPQQYKPRLLARQEFKSTAERDQKVAYRTIFGSVEYGFHITLDSYETDESKIHFLQAAEEMYKAMGCSKNDDSCITDNTKRNQVATLDLNISGSISTDRRMVVFTGDVYDPDITFTSAKNEYTFTNLRMNETSIKVTIPSTNNYLSDSSDLIIDSSIVQGSNRIIQGRILTEKTAKLISNETVPTPPPSPPCIEDWTCEEWSDCVGGTQTRTCVDNNACGTVNDKPSEYQTCEMCVESWLCTEWTECIDSTQTRVCTDNNVCGTTELKPHESQACEEIIILPEELIPTQGATPTGPSGIMGSGGGGGAVRTRIVVPTIAYEEEITYEFRNHPIYEVTFITLVDISNSKVSVEDLGSIRPTRASLIPDGLIYRYVDLVISNIEEENTDSIKIRLKVPISFYTENDIDPRRTKLQRWTGSDWDVLNTSQIGSDDTYYYFRTLSDSLSLFAITAELTGVSPPSTTCNKFCEEGEVLNIDSCECIPLAVTPGGIMLDYETFTYIVTFVSAFIIVLILHRVYRKYRGRGEIEKVMEKA